MRRMTPWCGLVFVLAHWTAGWSQSATTADPVIQLLMERIDRLEKRVAELERTGGVEQRPTLVASTAPMISEHAGGLPPHAQEQPQIATQIAPPTLPPEHPAFRLAGFSDFNFSATDQRGAKSGFSEGQLILHMTSNLSPKVNFFGEISFTGRTDAGLGVPPAPGFNAEIERAIVRFDQNDHFKVSFGRYHTPINYWNTAFHHGQWLQTTVSRPEMAQFGGRFIPVHFVGGLLEGAVPANGINLNYNFGIGNGRGTVISRGGDAGDNNNNRAWLINAFVKPDALYGLQVGASVYKDKVSAAGSDYRELISTAHAVWNRESPEIIAEFANVRHEAASGSSVFNSQAFYVQAAYRLPVWQKLWKPYYRFEYIHSPRTDPVFADLPNLAGSTLGVRYDLSSFAAIKFEYRNQRRAPGQPRINGGFMQTSFTF